MSVYRLPTKIKPTNRKYHKPFGGRWKPLELSGLFLFHPETDLKLLGTSVRGMMEEKEHGSIMSSFRRAIRLRIEPSVALVQKMLELLPASPFRSDLYVAFAGDAKARTRTEALGLWETTFLGIHAKSPNAQRRYAQDLIISIERASRPVASLFDAGHFAEAERVLQDNPVLRDYVAPPLTNILDCCNDSARLLLWRVSVAMEIRLGLLAAMDAELATQENPHAQAKSTMVSILPNLDDSSSTPTRRLLAWLMSQVDAQDSAQLLSKLQQAGININRATIFRWHAGSHQLNTTDVQLLAKLLPTEQQRKILLDLHSGGQQLHLLGYLSETCLELSQKAPRSWAPVQAMPLGCKSFESWCAARYPFWFNFHVQRIRERSQETT